MSVSDVKLIQGGKETLAGTAEYAMILDLAGELRENRGGTFKLARFRGAAASGAVRYKFVR